jgi:hypothetical protein
MEPATVFESAPVGLLDPNPGKYRGSRVKLPSGREAVVSEVSPGKFQAVIPPEDLPRYGIARMMRQPDGRYIPVLSHHSELIQLTPRTPEELGLRGVHWKGLRRLVISGLVSGSFPTPHVCLMSLASFVEHVEATRDREYWTEERKEAFRTTY